MPRAREALSSAGSDTIAAISTAWGEAGIAVVRVSGPDAVSLARGVLRFGPSGFPPPREMRLAALLDENGEPVDQVLAVHFAAPRSYTGEDVVEVQTHGGSLVAQTCLRSLLRRGARIAEPGEFTRRAFLNGRMDLSQAEAVLGVIRARSGEALHASARTLSGELSRAALRIRDGLLSLQGDLEVGLDFPEGEPPQIDEAEFRDALEALRAELTELEGRCYAGALLREGVRTVIAGRPNVGKSSLLNALLGRQRAIVTDQPGTTRDTLEETLLLQGIPFLLVDTAGLRDADGPVEFIGIERTREALKGAGLCLWLLDGSRPLDDEDGEYLRELDPTRTVVALNKSDLPRSADGGDVRTLLNGGAPVLSLSARTGEGLDALKENLVSLAMKGAAAELNSGLNVTARQLDDIRACIAAVSEAQAAQGKGMGQDVMAGALGRARLSLERLLGLSCDDVLLDSIFSRFCVGK